VNTLPVLTADLSSLPSADRDQRILALCDGAIGHLREARDVEEVVGLRNAAEAFAVYTRKMKAAVEAQNQCQLVVLLAEARIGAELKAAQERGEVARAGDNLRAGPEVPRENFGKATLPEIGISRKQAMNAKRLATAGEARIRDEVATATREGRRPARQNILAAIPSIAERPPECTQFTLWLRNGASLLPKLGDPALLPARLAQHNLPLPLPEARAMLAFLAALTRAA
jgi:hypothetical protein